MPDSNLGLEGIATSRSLSSRHRFGPVGLRLPVLKQGTPVPSVRAQCRRCRNYFTFGRASACLQAHGPACSYRCCRLREFFQLASPKGSPGTACCAPSPSVATGDSLGRSPVSRGPRCWRWWLYRKCERGEGKWSFE